MSAGLPKLRVVADHRATYADPLRVRAGDLLQVGGRDEEFPGWVWCTGPDGRSGWVPEKDLERTERGAVARRDYSARELDVRAGEEVIPSEEECGWVWVTNASGEAGWVPRTHLAPIA